MTQFVATPPGERITGRTDEQRVRLALRKNHARNHRIVQIARDISVRAAAGTTDSGEQPRGAVIVVEDVVHALRLTRRLENWGIVAKDVISTALTNDQQMLLAERQSIATPNFIVTLRALPDVDLGRVDYVIRAASGPGLLPLTAGPRTCDLSPLCVVDFLDQQHPILRRWLNERRQKYLAAGWMPCGLDPVRARVEDFVKHRGDHHDA